MPHRFAVIADPHMHDIRGNYRRDRIAAERLPHGMELRTLSDSIQSTRLFNESCLAFRATLDDIAARGIRHVILVGDYSDDGQDGSVAAALAVMRSYGERFGMRFYSTVGNHDVYGYSGRNLDRSFMLADGDSFCVSGSKPDDGDRTIFNPAMRCRSYAESLPQGLGFFRDGNVLHWETPFGTSDALEDRQYELSSPDGRHRRRFIDASYLVEPVPGVWLLSIDGNVFVPRDGDVFAAPEAEFNDSTDAGYNALVAHRPYLVDWIADVARRAEREGKRLVSFTHYPAVDPFDNTRDDEERLFGRTIFVRRTPHRATADILEQAGLRLHFSGHLHIDNVTRHGRLINVAVPSSVGYPGGYRVLSLHEDGAELETVRLPDLPLDAAILSAYRTEAERTGIDAGGLLEATDYNAFIARHLTGVIRHRFLTREWPEALQQEIQRLTLADLLRQAGVAAAFTPPELDELEREPAMRLVEALYFARHNAAWRYEMPAQERDLFESLLLAGTPQGTSLGATLLRNFRRHFDKPDFRRMTFARDWTLTTKSARPEKVETRIAEPAS